MAGSSCVLLGKSHVSSWNVAKDRCADEDAQLVSLDEEDVYTALNASSQFFHVISIFNNFFISPVCNRLLLTFIASILIVDS